MFVAYKNSAHLLSGHASYVKYFCISSAVQSLTSHHWQDVVGKLSSIPWCIVDYIWINQFDSIVANYASGELNKFELKINNVFPDSQEAVTGDRSHAFVHQMTVFPVLLVFQISSEKPKITISCSKDPLPSKIHVTYYFK